MFLLEPESILSQAKEMFIKAYEHIRISHEKFYQELLKYQYDKQTTLLKIIDISQAHELILLELCTGCENLHIGEVGKFAMKMHLQNVEITKWVLENGSSFIADLLPPTQNALRGSVKFNEKKQRFSEETSQQYYRMKQNSLFMAEGLNKQIAQMQSSLDSQINYERVQIDNLLNKRQLVQRIQPSDNEHLLFQAVDIISHQSQVFKKLAQDNKENFANTYRQLNLKPYSKLKIEIDQVMKEKVSKASQKLFQTLDRFICKKNGADEQKTKISSRSVEVQADFIHQNDEKASIEEKRKAEKIKQLNVCLSQQKMKVEKLQSLLRQKINHFEEKLVKVRFEKNKQNQISLLKKSLTQITSINNFKLQVEEEGGQNKRDENLQAIKKSLKFNKANKINKKTVLKGSEENAYQKSLMRIKFNIQDDLSDENQSSESEHVKRYKICNMETSYCFNPKNNSFIKNLSCRSIEQYRSFMKSRFSFCLNVYDYGIKTSQQFNKNPSLLTITNIKQVARKDDEGKSGKIAHSADRSSFTNMNNTFFAGQKKGKKKLKSHQFFRISGDDEPEFQQGMVSITNKFPENLDQELLIDKEIQFKQTQTQNNEKVNEMKKMPRDKNRIKNNFQVLHLVNDSYSKNRSRINMMMSELKKKRYCRSGVSQNRMKKNEGQVYLSQIQPAALLQLYLSQERAMEAQLEFSVSTAVLVEDRKSNKEPSNPQQLENNKREDYYEHLCKKILKAMHMKKKDQRVYIEIQNAIKRPFSIIKGIPLSYSQSKQYLSEHEIKNFIRFITSLHLRCEQMPCLHLKQFLTKLGLQIC